MEIRIIGFKEKVKDNHRFRTKIGAELRKITTLVTLVITFLPKMNHRATACGNIPIENFLEIIPLAEDIFDESQIAETLVEIFNEEGLEVIFLPPVRVWIGRKMLLKE
jgi:hypothetical protein